MVEVHVINGEMLLSRRLWHMCRLCTSHNTLQMIKVAIYIQPMALSEVLTIERRTSEITRLYTTRQTAQLRWCIYEKEEEEEEEKNQRKNTKMATEMTVSYTRRRISKATCGT